MANVRARRSIWSVAAASAVLLAMGLAAPAAASTGTTGEPEHCVTNLSSTSTAPSELYFGSTDSSESSPGPTDPSEPAAWTCFGTFTEAIAVATGGRITDAPATTEEAAEDAELDARIDALADEAVPIEPTDEEPPVFAEPHPQFVLSIEFKDRGFAGSSHTFHGDETCLQATYSVAYVGDAWNDSISSFKVYSKCRVKHYEHQDFEGASLPRQVTQEYIGEALDEKTSSLKWD